MVFFFGWYIVSVLKVLDFFSMLFMDCRIFKRIFVNIMNIGSNFFGFDVIGILY